MSWLPPTLSTERLLLRPLTVDDAEGVFAYASNPNVAAHMNFDPHQVIVDSLRFIQEYALARYHEGVPEPLGITLQSSPERVIGVIGCRWISEKDQCMELAYALAEEHWGRGFATEAARALTAYCFEKYAVHRIQAHCTAENVASARVLQKVGMKHEGTMRACAFLRGRFWDRQIFAVPKHECADLLAAAD